MVKEVKEHLTDKLIPFWENLRDEENGGYYGYLGYDLVLDKKAEKGCILNSRILWFFSNAYTLLKKESLLEDAKHAYIFLTKHCIDEENGGVYWSMTYDGKVLDSTKHTYNQAFAVYALSSYYEASKDEAALALAKKLFGIIETKCKDSFGYKESLTREFADSPNDKLSENGVMADRTMNTLLHVMEAYTELYRVSTDAEVKTAIEQIFTVFTDKIYNANRHRQEVFFDNQYNSLIDLHSFGHDIEASWLIDRAVEIVDDDSERWSKKLTPVTSDLARQVFEEAFDGNSLAYEKENGIVNQKRVWWVQAETVVGFLNAYRKSGKKEEKYLKAAKDCLGFIFEHMVDKREGSEWYSEVTADGKSVPGIPIVDPWKCPYHNGRMCFEIIRSGE
ncbi:MAG: N-acylglucosamine 2-epimerase [Butyrivibrio sp.]|nr:N-acylglucosamine 2-epimerase [Butyrivibrio sp.]